MARIHSRRWSESAIVWIYRGGDTPAPSSHRDALLDLPPLVRRPDRSAHQGGQVWRLLLADVIP